MHNVYAHIGSLSVVTAEPRLSGPLWSREFLGDQISEIVGITEMPTFLT